MILIIPEPPSLLNCLRCGRRNGLMLDEKAEQTVQVRCQKEPAFHEIRSWPAAEPSCFREKRPCF